MRFKDYLKLQETELSVPLGTVQIPNSAFGALTSIWTGSEMPSPGALNNGGFGGSDWVHQDFDLGLPTTNRTSKILSIRDDRKNRVHPITISLADGTILTLPLEVFKNKIKGEPQVGKMMTVVFQRRPDDKSPDESQIQGIYCF